MITETFDEYVKKMFVTREIDARVGTSLTALQTRFDTRFPFKPTTAIPVVSKSGLVHAPDNWTSAFRMRELWESQTEKRKAAGKVIY